MRPVRLLLDGFGCYRQPAEADFSDVEFFALVGPTGSGKSTLIDGMCFALYGTVPRWRKENAIAQALAPAANACRVCLVFEAAGKRYAAVRALTRDKRGQVHTKEARLELLDPRVPPDAPITQILEASLDQIAEGPDLVKARVQQILGLTYEHFTQSVLLPQGRFAEFLNAKAADRQDLLVELLAFGVYNAVGQAARKRAELAADRMRIAEAARSELADATEEAENRAADRVGELAGLARTVDDKLQSLERLRDQAGQAAQQAREAREETGLLAAVRTPAEVPGLAHRIGEADRLLAECRRLRDAADEAETHAQRACEALPDKTSMEMLRKIYQDQRELTVQLQQQEQALAGRQADARRRAAAVQAAEQALREAGDELAHAERSHAAAVLAVDLRVGDPCPVCLQPVASLPHHPAPADLTRAKAAVSSADRQLRLEQAAYQKAASAAAAASSNADSTRQRIGQSSAQLTGAPSEADITASLEAITAAGQALAKAQRTARTRRAELAAAEKARASLIREETEARAGLGRARDSLVRLGVPAIEDTDLAAAWHALASWAQAQHAERARRQPDLDAAATALQQQAMNSERALTRLLAEHGIGGSADPTRAAATVAIYHERAANHLATVQDNRKKAARLDDQIRAHHEDEQVAALLGQLLRATSFERWLCGEALDSLMTEASETLMELSGGQYQLDRDDRNDLIVIDHQDAGASRPAHTLSGGETFQASLALALALSRQVVGLSAGMRDLNSMFLDEGFGTLDEDTLETVATTLERLAADSDRMVGVITHVQALADRVPVRFVVSHTGGTSALRKERTL
jgi:DNA repair protein SbcC/Rad50